MVCKNADSAKMVQNLAILWSGPNVRHVQESIESSSIKMSQNFDLAYVVCDFRKKTEEVFNIFGVRKHHLHHCL